MAQEKGRPELLDAARGREALFDLDTINARVPPAAEEVERAFAEHAQQIARAQEVLSVHQTSYVSELRAELDVELLQTLDGMTEPSGFVFGQMKALRALGRRMDAELAWAKGVIGDGG